MKYSLLLYEESFFLRTPNMCPKFQQQKNCAKGEWKNEIWQRMVTEHSGKKGILCKFLM